jgi:acetylglutamate kinase
MDSIDSNLQVEWLAKADILTDALPFMRRYNGQIVVIKYGGHAMVDAGLAAEFAADMVLVKQVGMNPLVVHGGGPQIGAMLKRLEIESNFIDGLRVTDAATVEIVEMVLSGTLNKAIVAAINTAGGRAIGLSGKDGGLLRAKKLLRSRIDPDSQSEEIVDLGFVGDLTHVDGHILTTLADNQFVPVVAPIALGHEGETFNINADTAAGAVAAATHAKRLLLLTDVAGVLDANGDLIEELSVAEAEALIADGTIKGGMIPKIETCIEAIKNGVQAAVILDGRVKHAVLLELFTPHGVGTIIRGS